MASGIAVEQECIDAFTSLKMDHNYHYVIFRINEEKTKVVVEHKQAKESKADNFEEFEKYYKEFVLRMEEVQASKECRFAVLDAAYLKGDVTKHKIVFMYWGPEGASIKIKMVYSATKEALTKALGQGIALQLQANDDDDLKYDNIKTMLLDRDRYN